jgi:endo-1,4-beta-xylanase
MSPTFQQTANHREESMLRRHSYPAIGSAVVVAAVLSVSAAANAANRPVGDELLSAAEARIEKHRQADAVVTVVDAQGRPVPGATVRVEQTRHEFLFGCNIFKWGKVGQEQRETEYRERFTEVFNFATLPFYWWSYERRPGQPIHDQTERVAEWCQEQSIVCKGHPLAWNYAEPRWLPDETSEILGLQLARIEDCVRRFNDLIDTWDVVNEATHFDRAQLQDRAPKLTKAWADIGKVEFTRRCFLEARRANPQATLLINDYRVDAPYGRVIEQLVDEDGERLYDVIGIQSHQHGGTWTNEKIWDVCERFSRFGVPLHFTETTILSGKQGWRRGEQNEPWESTAEGEANQAREVERFYTMLYSHPAVEAITWWDFTDLHAWQGAPAGFLRKDMSPKPAYEMLRELIKRKWWTGHELKTDRAGGALFRGTLGDYRVTVSMPGRAAVTRQMTVARGQPNQVTVRVPPVSEENTASSGN